MAIGNRKRRAKDDPCELYSCRIVESEPLTLADMPEFKRLLVKAIKADKIFMTYNGKKYSKSWAVFIVKVVEQEGK